jgi:hypothetical protein
MIGQLKGNKLLAAGVVILVVGLGLMIISFMVKIAIFLVITGAIIAGIGLLANYFSKSIK